MQILLSVGTRVVKSKSDVEICTLLITHSCVIIVMAATILRFYLSLVVLLFIHDFVCFSVGCGR